MRIIAFGYKKNSGKDTAGKFLDTILRCDAPNLTTRKISFAAKLKDICHQLFGWAGLKPGIYYETHRDEKEKILPLIEKSPRQIWIEVGNYLRKVYPLVWINYALQSSSGDIIIITDLGFQNEAEAVQKAGGYLIKIDAMTRLKAAGAEFGTDGREIELDNWNNWNRIIHNNGTLAELNQQIELLAQDVLESI